MRGLPFVKNDLRFQTRGLGGPRRKLTTQETKERKRIRNQEFYKKKRAATIERNKENRRQQAWAKRGREYASRLRPVQLVPEVFVDGSSSPATIQALSVYPCRTCGTPPTWGACHLCGERLGAFFEPAPERSHSDQSIWSLASVHTYHITGRLFCRKTSNKKNLRKLLTIKEQRTDWLGTSSA
jgi:hypothetical protein